MHGNMKRENTPVIILGFGSVGQHVAQLLLIRSPQRPRPNLLVTAISDSSGGISCPDGLPLSEVLRWKQAGHPLNSFLSSIGDITHHVDSLQMLTRVAKPGHIAMDATPVNLTDGGMGLACCRWAAGTGVHLVLANKAPLVLSYRELMNAAQQPPASSIEFSGTVCGGLPVINVGRRDLACSARLDLVQGIFNSTSNYVLSRMAAGESPELALSHARAAGIAEADASLDLEGVDSANKLVIICNAVLDIPATLSDVQRQGITHLTGAEVLAAASAGQAYRLVATARRREEGAAAASAVGQLAEEDCLEDSSRVQLCSAFELSVRPTLVPLVSFFGQCVDTEMCVVFVSHEFETISLKTDEKGVFPTAAALLRDCCSIAKRAV